MRCCWSGSSTNSARRRSRVIGVRRSCEMAAIMRVRSSTKRRRRNCMSLKARIAWRTSRGPRSGSGGTVTSTPRRCAACARVRSGAVRRCRTQMESAMTATTMAPMSISDWFDQIEAAST